MNFGVFFENVFQIKTTSFVRLTKIKFIGVLSKINLLWVTKVNLGCNLCCVYIQALKLNVNSKK